MRPLPALRVAITGAVLLTACDPILGAGQGTPPDPGRFLRVQAAQRAAVLVLVAGYPATDSEFNYDGYPYGGLEATVPAGWALTVQCENHASVPMSCAVTNDVASGPPVHASWSTPSPRTGMAPGQSAAFTFAPERTGTYRIASLVDGSEASGTWAILVVTPDGPATISAGGLRRTS